MPASTPAHNVPVALSGFIGRVHDVAEVVRLLESGRLLTLTGAGGVGKTRLAREVAALFVAEGSDRARRFGDGVWWVELAPLTQGADVVATVAATLGVRQAPDAASLAATIDAGRMLLVLDNCEHLVDDIAELTDRLLRLCPALTVLVTSREALGVEGELVWPVPVLSHPRASGATNTVSVRDDGDGGSEVALAELAEYDAVRLFVERARSVQPGFALNERTAPAVRAVTARLDGLPLAIELAAANVGTFGVDALAARLDDVLAVGTRGRRTALPRHRTLRALLDWSYALLEETERTLLCRLSVFRTDVPLDAVEAVCGGDGLPERVVLIALGRLVEHSLVDVRDQEGETRYHLLETVRQYGASRLAEVPGAEGGARARHAAWVAAFTAKLAPSTWSAARGRTVLRLARDVEEIRAALSWAASPGGDPMTGVRIAGALAWFWFSGVPWSDARALTAAALDAADRDGVPDAARTPEEQAAIATLLYPIAGLAYFAGEADTILRLAGRAETLWDGVDRACAADGALRQSLRSASVRGRSVMRQQAGLARGMRGLLDLALADMDAAVDVARDGDDAWLHAVMLMRRALVAARGGRLDAAMADYVESVPRLRAVGERWFLSLALEGMAVVALAQGELQAAAAHARDGVAVLRAEPDQWFISRSLDTLAAVAVAACRNDADANAASARALLAARLLGAAAVLRARSGTEVIGPDRERYANTIAAARAALGDAFQDAWNEGYGLDLDGVFALVESVDSTLTTSTMVVTSAPESVGVPPEPAPLPPEAPVAPVASRQDKASPAHVLAFGPLAVLRHGVPVPAAELTPAKARELLLFLTLNPPRTKEQIALALWPDASEAQVRNAFHVTLHHVRRILGHKDAVTFEGVGYALARAGSTAREVTVDSDVDAVLAAVHGVQAADRAAHPSPAARGVRLDTRTAATSASVSVPVPVDPATLETWRTALECARRGRVGEGVDAGDWIVEHQDRLRTLWGDAMEALARLQRDAGAPDVAVSLLETLVAADPLREGAHRALMTCYTAAGEPSRALAHFDGLTALLQREVGAAPARETRALADSIRRG